MRPHPLENIAYHEIPNSPCYIYGTKVQQKNMEQLMKHEHYLSGKMTF